MFVGANISSLHHILGMRVGSQNAPSNSIKALVISTHNDLEKRSFACQDSRDQFHVTDWLQARPLFDSQFGHEVNISCL
jgi:hypothetical protein